MLSKVYSATLVGVDARVVEIEVDVAPGLPGIAIVGLADISIREARERTRACIRNLEGYRYPMARISVNLAPAAVPKFGTQFDLPICVGILAASGQLELGSVHSARSAFIGELALDGSVRPVAGVLAMVLAMKAGGFVNVFLPSGNAGEAALVGGMNIYPVRSIAELLEHFRGGAQVDQFTKTEKAAGNASAQPARTDFSEIVGQRLAKRAVEIAAAGGHNILMVGYAGVGKTMLAEAVPSILPELTSAELLDVTKVYSSAGLLVNGLAVQRPFRNPHHTVTVQAFLGGGRSPAPGEITLAHHGVLFLDELPEFPRAVIEALRQPLEAGCINIARLSYTYSFPCRFLLMAAHNPCPCGSRSCTCTPHQVVAYRQKISAPILDRIDLRVTLSDATAIGAWGSAGSAAAETSATVRRRVCAAREVQALRCAAAGMPAKLNAHLSRQELGDGAFTLGARQLLDDASAKYAFSPRGYLKVQRVSRTVADLVGSDQVRAEHVAEACQYRVGEPTS